MRLISSRRRFHCSGVVTFVPSFIVSTSGISVRVGSSLGPGSFPNGALIGGTGISLGSGPSAMDRGGTTAFAASGMGSSNSRRT